MNRLIAFIRGTIDEAKQVSWPTNQETIRMSISVILFSAITGLVITGVDQALARVVEEATNKDEENLFNEDFQNLSVPLSESVSDVLDQSSLEGLDLVE